MEDDVLHLKGDGKTGPKGNFCTKGRDTGNAGKGRNGCGEEEYQFGFMWIKENSDALVCVFDMFWFVLYVYACLMHS